MEVESIQINTTKEKFFLEYLTLKRPIINAMLTKINGRKTVLNDIPMRVLAELLFLNDKYNDLPDDKKWTVVFSPESREYIIKKLRMEKHYLYVYFTQLRKIKVLNGKKINKLFIVNAADHDLSFKFVLNGQNGEQVDKKDNT